MYIQPDQIHEILSPKKNCQRGLEEYIVNSHKGDKQKNHSKKGTGYSSTKKGKPDGYNSYYGYINNPVYRVGSEGDPGPNSYSSRHLTEENNRTTLLNPNESELHLLTTAIDSGSVLLPPVKWNQNWGYDRGDIPNIIVGDEDIHNQKEYLRRYDDEVDLRYIDYQANGINTRYLPIYDRSHISNDEEPDGLHEHDTHDRYYGIGRRIIPPSGGQNMKIIEGLSGPTVEWKGRGNGKIVREKIKEIGDIKNVVEESVNEIPGIHSFARVAEDKIEGYQNVNLNSRRGYGKYGNPVPDGYGRLGGSNNHYEVIRHSSFNGINSASYLIPDDKLNRENFVQGNMMNENIHHSGLGAPYQKPRTVVRATFRNQTQTTNPHSYLILWIAIGVVSVILLGAAQKAS